MTPFQVLKKVLYGLWIGIVVFFAYLFLFKNHLFDTENLSQWMQNSGQSIWLLYVAISFIRGFFLIPSTPFVLLGIVLFPHQPLQVLAVSMAGVVFSATLLFYFSDSIGFSQYFEERYPKQVEWMKAKLGGKYQVGFIYAWSIFPPVPTDLICYITGILKIRYLTMIAGVFLGELTLNSIYVAVGPSIVTFFENLI